MADRAGGKAWHNGSVLQHATRVIRRSQTESPKTVLGFFATTLAVLLTFIGIAIAVLARYQTYTELIPFLLFFGALAFIGLLTGVFYIILFRDPSQLMLGQVTGSEYAEIQRVQLGDSRSGERQLPIEQRGTEPPVVLTELELPGSTLDDNTSTEDDA